MNVQTDTGANVHAHTHTHIQSMIFYASLQNETGKVIYEVILNSLKLWHPIILKIYCYKI
jgi:hypothetical protein